MASDRGRLVLTRTPGQIIKIGQDIEIEVVNITGRQVKLSVIAPRDVAIDRLEIWQRKHRTRQEQGA